MQESWRTQFQNLNEPILPSAELLQTTRQRMEATKPQTWLPRLQKTLAVAACTCLIFVGAVNLSPAFASAAAKVPLMRELVAAVSFDPSMKAAIEHHYVQLVKQSDSDNGYRLEVEYLVADTANLTVYYRFLGMGDDAAAFHEQFRYMPELQDLDGNRLDGYGITWGGMVETEDELQAIKCNFTEGTLPEQLQLQVTVEQVVAPADDTAQDGLDDLIASYAAPKPDYETVATLTVPLHIDADSLFNLRTIDLQQTIEIAGQTILLEKAEIYPTQMRVYWQEAADNTAYIANLPMTLQGRQHHRWETISNGVSGIGSIGQPRQTWLDSSWFADDGVYLLQIEEIALLPKENRQVTYDYRSNTFTGLPAYIQLKAATPCDAGLFLEFEIQSSNSTVHGSVFDRSYLDGYGNQQEWPRTGSGHSYDKQEKDQIVYYFYNQFLVKNYETGPLTFTVNWAPLQKLEEPIIIPLEETKVVPVDA